MKRKLEKKEVTFYVSPLLEMMTHEMEHGIAAGSASVISSNTSGEVQEQWDIGTERDQHLNW